MSVPVVGMIGGGQLARMTHQASIPLGLTFRVLSNLVDDAAAQVVRNLVVGDHRDLDTLREFAGGCDVVTFDHEHVPDEHLRVLEREGVVLRPRPGALIHAQDKAVMRRRLTAVGVPCPRWRVVADVGELSAFADEVGWPVVLKVARGGYDGKGVWVVDRVERARPVLDYGRHAGVEVLAEEHVEFEREIAVLVARSPYGQAVSYPVVETVQRDGICAEVIAPAPGIEPDHAVAAQRQALRIAGDLGVAGVMVVEMFDTKDGVVVGELAMRPHNSGHWTIDGALTSQFEQHLRAVLDLPLGSPTQLAPFTVMVNVLGGSREDISSGFAHCMARDPGLRIHAYGKSVRRGRKVGHVTVSGDDLGDLRERAWHAANYLRGESS